MSTQNRIIEIDYDSYVLPESVTDADMLKLMQLMPLLMKARQVDSRTRYIPDKDSEYGERVVRVENRTMKIALTINTERVLNVAQFDAEHAAGQAIYDAAHPKPIVSDATIAEVKANERNQPAEVAPI